MRRWAIGFAKKAAVAIGTVACLFVLFSPLPEKISKRESYVCVWADGSASKESFSSAYESLFDIDGESVVLLRNGLTGKIKSKAGETYETLEYGNLAELLRCEAAGTRIDGAALYQKFSKRVWYNGSYFIWTGDRIKRVSRASGDEVVFLEGNVTSRILRETKAETLLLRAEAKISADSFYGSNVKSVVAAPPYSEKGGAVYLNTAGGKRLIAALGGVKELRIDEDLAFADRGALLFCNELTFISLPFLGSAKSPFGASYAGEFAHLFSDGEKYRVPETLSRVEVTDGRVESFAFYACSNLKEISVCKVEKSEISATAFSGLKSLEVLHTPKRDVTLTGKFTSSVVDCGCTVFQRENSQK